MQRYTGLAKNPNNIFMDKKYPQKWKTGENYILWLSEREDENHSIIFVIRVIYNDENHNSSRCNRIQRVIIKEIK